MGYNLSIGCLDCKVQCSSLRGEESRVIRAFGERHGRGHRKDVSIDNGYMEKDWAEGSDPFPDIYDQIASDRRST
jgi:hypothetical protein